MQKFIKGSLLSLIFLLIQLQANTAGAEILELKCKAVHTNPHAMPPDSDGLIWYFHLNMKNKEAEFSHEINSSKMELKTLFWNDGFIGLANGNSSNIITAVSSYLFDRKNSNLVATQLNQTDFSFESRQSRHNLVKINGSLENILMQCSKLGGF